MGTKFVIPALAFFLSIIAPAYQDLVAGDPSGFKGDLSEFTLMDNVVSKRPIVTLRRTGNILQRRDAGCTLVYKKLMGTDVRQVEVTEVYGAAQQCNHAFYQDALKDFRNDDPLFAEKILPFFKQVMTLDLTSNSYFGDVSRANNPNAQWSTNKFDGVFKWMVGYYKNNVIPNERGISLAATDFAGNPNTAYSLIVQMYRKQGTLMRVQPVKDKVYYVTQAIADGYETYLSTTGTTEANKIIMDGIEYLSYKKIPIVVQPLWEAILLELYGTDANAAVLTVKGNFVFATDKEYGEDTGQLDEKGKPEHEALRVWYEDKDLSWYYQMFLKAGTQIALPEFVVFAVPTAMLA